jgi:hypothetical protein
LVQHDDFTARRADQFLRRERVQRFGDAGQKIRDDADGERAGGNTPPVARLNLSSIQMKMAPACVGAS